MKVVRTGSTSSSRSHSIFTVVCECQTTRENGDLNLTAGKLNLVDLAGSERQSKVGALARVLVRVLVCARLLVPVLPLSIRSQSALNFSLLAPRRPARRATG